MRVEGAAVVFAAGLWLTAASPLRRRTSGRRTWRRRRRASSSIPATSFKTTCWSDLPADAARGVGPFAETRSAVIGKMARRTLLPGHGDSRSPGSTIRVLVVNGAQVKLVYIDGGLSISAVGMALQDGAAGDSVKVRNDDSGVTVTGVVQPDGAVRVSGG